MAQKTATINKVQAGLKWLVVGRQISEIGYLEIYGVEAVAMADGLPPEYLAQIKTKLAAVKSAFEALKTADDALIVYVNALNLAPPGASSTGC